ncbi:MAG TPA: type IV secretion system DNA-binding domain-containing protein [Solirubrobacteraceae bacterium]|nr:type IV secretion system DNA-binding domain-containing protein [Solirubrobacteraceae bacterium]
MIAALVEAMLPAACVVGGAGWCAAWLLRALGMRWIWALAAFPAGLLLRGTGVTLPLWLAACVAAYAGARMERRGAPARQLLGEVAGGGELVAGVSHDGRPVPIGVGAKAGSHVLVVGATGSGKTVSEAWICSNLVAAGRAAVAIDPKGDADLRAALADAARRRGARFAEWTPEGPLAYNPYAVGSAAEVADKALAAEDFTEPHYLRQAQRYLGHAARAMRGAGVVITPASLLEHMDPRRLEETVRSLAEPQATVTHAYLDGLTERQLRELAGVRDRLAVLVESELGEWLEPSGAGALELETALRERAVVYVRLDADRRPLLARMLGTALICDLVAISARAQRDPLDAVVVVDEFAAVAAAAVARLFGRARSAGITLVLGAQEFADLRGAAGFSIRDQVLGNVGTVIAHRQLVPDSAALVSRLAGRHAQWTTTYHTGAGPLRSRIVRRRARRSELVPRIEPEEIANLAVGQAVVIRPGSVPVIARIHRPPPAAL